MPFGCVTLGDKKNYNQPSEVTDRYDLGQVIKTEEFCEIFRAKDKTTGKLHTCKKFQKRDGRKVRKAAKNEIGILKMVKHPNILQLVDVFVTRKEYFIFLELATGREVFDWILDQGYYSERDTSNVVRQVLEAVAYLHSLKIVHRNLKLENLVYYNRLKNSKIVISDFHLAKLENGLIKEPCGTPEYLAPEVVGRQRYGRPVDCWAIGVIMYILLSGNPPFYEEVEEDDYENHDKNLFRKILAGDYEFDSPYWDDISQAAKDLVTRLMEVEQDQRITAEEAISHEWISGNAASDKNIKDGVCAQIEKNFARAKWKTVVPPQLQMAVPPQPLMGASPQPLMGASPQPLMGVSPQPPTEVLLQPLMGEPHLPWKKALCPPSKAVPHQPPRLLPFLSRLWPSRTAQPQGAQQARLYPLVKGKRLLALPRSLGGRPAEW
uniref:CaM kinase-like vesicle-associated protein n=1 Tax=Sus scrofa TaxID=9823 RepID=I3LSE4_PIG